MCVTGFFYWAHLFARFIHAAAAKYFILLPNNPPLSSSTTHWLPIHHLGDVWFASFLGYYEWCYYEHSPIKFWVDRFSLFLAIHLGEEFLGHVVTMFSISEKLANCWESSCTVCIPSSLGYGSTFSSLLTLGTVDHAIVPLE